MERSLRVLVVDDNEEARFCLKEQLETNGHVVVGEASNLAGTLEAYKKHQPQLVMLDLSLEKEDGLTILKALRQEDPQACVCILSANEMKKVKEQAMSAGARQFLVKPLEEERLVAALNAL